MSIEHNDNDGAEFDAAFDDEDLTDVSGDDTELAVGDDVLDDDSNTDPIDDDDTEEDAGDEQADDEGDAENETGDDQGDDDDLSGIPEEDQQAYKSWQGRLRKREQELLERENALKAAAGNGDNPEVDNDDVAGDDTDTTDDVEDEDIQAFLDDFPEMEEPLKKLVQKAVAEATVPVLENVTALTAEQERQRYEEHISAVKARHEDFGEIVESGVLEGWIENLPYKDAVKFKTVCESGTAPEVIEMLDRYKQDNRKGQKQNELSRRRSSQKRAGAAIPNHSSRVANTSGNADPDDFDAGWEEAD